MRARTAAIVGVLGLATGWMAGSGARVQEPREPARVERRGPRPLGSGEPPAPHTQQLRLRLQEQPRSPSPGRNPFTFGARVGRATPAPAARRADAAAVPAAEASPDPAPAAPRLTLSGIASHRDGDQVTWTAILSDAGALVFATAGDTLPGGVRVTRVDESSVALVDADGAERVLRLTRPTP